MGWNVAVFIACVAAQYALARGMREPNSSHYLAMTGSFTLIFGGTLLVAAILSYVTPPSP